MRIIITGGGSGGHFYPLIAVARSLKKILEVEGIKDLELIYTADRPYDQKLLDEEKIRFIAIEAGKIRRYFSLLNLSDLFLTFYGTLRAIWILYLNYPDIIFAKGGYASFPTLFAARLLRIPVVIHETDAIPGRVTSWASRFAKRIAISFPETFKYFPKDKIAQTGNPIRREVMGGSAERAKEIFSLESGIPVIFVVGGSQGAEKINAALLDILPKLLESAQVIHQCGQRNFEDMKLRSSTVLEKSPFRKRYILIPFLDEEQYSSASKSASIIISRAGGGSIFEIAVWGIPAILVPLPTSAQDHQRENAYSYARAGGAEVIEEKNLEPHILLDRVDKLLKNEERKNKMREAAKKFARPDAADNIAKEIVNLIRQHS